MNYFNETFIFLNKILIKGFYTRKKKMKKKI